MKWKAGCEFLRWVNLLSVLLAVPCEGYADTLPPTLSGTGFFTTDKHGYSPQYPLWSDGAQKLRWIALPAGSYIDGTQADRWEFPIGTRLWKQIGYSTAVETRYMKRAADGRWRYAAYRWREQGTDADLVEAKGVKQLPVADAPNGTYSIPSREDCVSCHEGTAVPVLGFSALQLSPDRDPGALHTMPVIPDQLDLNQLVANGWLRNLPDALLRTPPRINAPTPLTRAVLGYWHGNCGHCHNTVGPLESLELSLWQESADSDRSLETALATTLGHASRFQPQGMRVGSARLVPGQEDRSIILLRMRSRNPNTQMPPLGTRMPDQEALNLIQRWLTTDLQQPHM